MLRPWDETSYYDDPVVRRTVARLRISIAAVLLLGMATIMLAGVTVRYAYHDGSVAAEPRAGAAAVKRPARPAKAVSQRGGKQPTRVAGTAGSAAATAAAEAPLKLRWPTLALLFGGFPLLVLVSWLFVRRPYAGARSHSAALVHAYRALEESTLETFAALNASVEAKDRYTAGHGLRVTMMTVLIGQEMGLNESEIDALRHAATFHDIGKIAVPDSILQKQGTLGTEEQRLVQAHAAESARICGKVAVLRESVPAIRHHHERIDGTGYPDRIAGSAIPLGARIIAVADAWDAITSDRPYRRGQDAAVALDEIRRCAGRQFDPSVVEAFENVLARDPWMFGLTPELVAANPAAPGQRIEIRPFDGTPLAA